MPLNEADVIWLSHNRWHNVEPINQYAINLPLLWKLTLLFSFSLVLCFLLFHRADWRRQFLTQSPQPVLYRESEGFRRGQGDKAWGGHCTKVAGKFGHQRIGGNSRAGSRRLQSGGWDDGGPGLLLSGCLIRFVTFLFFGVCSYRRRGGYIMYFRLTLTLYMECSGSKLQITYFLCRPLTVPNSNFNISISGHRLYC